MEGLGSASVGLVANPESSKDIRRVVTYASTVPNHEKVNRLRRVLVGLSATAVQTVYYFPDAVGLVPQAADRLALPFALVPLDLPVTGTAEDTSAAAQALTALGAGCLITLGGDGTARAAVKGSRTLPLLPLSTGTNNAFPLLIEPTLAGLAAGSVATVAPQSWGYRPLLEVWRNDECVDLALVDVAAVAATLGGRAVWEIERVRAVATTQLAPGTVGLSAVGGHLGLPVPQGTLAVGVTLGPAGAIMRAPIAPGTIADVPVLDYAWLADGAAFALPSGTVLALDGERELVARDDARWSVRPVAAGVPVVHIEPALLACTRAVDSYA